MSVERDIWEYYKEFAYKAGFREKPTTGNDEETAVSVWWIYDYFSRNFNQLNWITQAFLGMRDPSSLGDTDIDTPVQFDIHKYLVEPDPNAEQERAIRTSLKKPVSFIQGPPGTGKSRTILNIMSCIINGLQDKSVAMVSANNAAIGVIAHAINEYDPPAGTTDPVEINRAKLKNVYAELGNISEKLKKYNEDHKGMPGEFVFECDVDETTGVKVVNNVSFGDFRRLHRAITSTIHSLKKLFTEGPGLQYDYVIMDESSQVNPILGIIAMTSAKHLVLVGDQYQLPPIISKEHADEVNGDPRFAGVPDFYKIKSDPNMNMPSILTLCRKRFTYPGAGNKIMLKEHYRCHPGIIEFCNLNVYGGMLQMNAGTTKGGAKIDTMKYKVPIKVMWYQGDYCEPVDIGEKRTDISKRNGKQITIFIREELPNLILRIMNKKDTMDSVGVLSPFRGVLDELAKEINKALPALPPKTKDLKVTVNEPEKDDSDDGINSIPTLTISKSQGREYDVIYLLPAEDRNWERPWSQGKNLINVAVSRAKEELRIIVSSALMSKRMQLALTEAKEALPGTFLCPENFRYVQKLIDYAKIANDYDRDYNNNRADWDKIGKYKRLHDPMDQHHLDGIEFVFPESLGSSPVDFGFYQSKTKSVFDAIPVIRRDASEVAQDMECPLLCILNAILSVPVFTRENYHLYTDVMLCDFENSSGKAIVERQQIWDMLDDKGYSTPEEDRSRPDHLELHMDIALCDEEKRVLMMIELDGGFHRFDKEPEKLKRQKLFDEAKTALMKRYFKDVPFLRLKTDGTDYYEKEKIERKLRRGAASDVYCPAKELTEDYSQEDADSLRSSLLYEEFLEQRPIYELEEDGHSWIVKGSPKEDYLRPTVKGTSIGIVRHYGSDENGEIFMNEEYLPRFMDTEKARQGL